MAIRAGLKISELRELENAALDDFIVINDASVNTTKRITVQNFLKEYTTNLVDSDDGVSTTNLSAENLTISNKITALDIQAINNVTFSNMTDPINDITINRFVADSDSIALIANDTSLPTTAAVKSYVDDKVSDKFGGYTGQSVGDVIATGAMSTTTEATFYLHLTGNEKPSNISVAGTFNLTSYGDNTYLDSSLTPVFDNKSSNKLLKITVDGLGPYTEGDLVDLVAGTDSASITPLF